MKDSLSIITLREGVQKFEEENVCKTDSNFAPGLESEP